MLLMVVAVIMWLTALQFCHIKIANVVVVYDVLCVYCIQYSMMFIISYSITQQHQCHTFTGDQQLQE